MSMIHSNLPLITSGVTNLFSYDYMQFGLPNRLRSYKVCEASPTDELLVLGQVYAGVGDYAASFIDRKHLSVAKFCSTQLKKIVRMLIDRKAVASEDELYDMTEVEIGVEDLSDMSVDDLYQLYRRWPMRHKARAAEGREHFTFYYEGLIVSELQKRKASCRTEQFKKDYCILTYESELENLSFVLGVPISVNDEKCGFSPEKDYTYTELTELIKYYANYCDVSERELLVRYVDYALDYIKKIEDKSSVIALASEIVALGRKKIISIPQWLTDVFTTNGRT